MRKTKFAKRLFLSLLAFNISSIVSGQEPSQEEQSNQYVQTIDNEYYRQVNPEAWRFHKYWFSEINGNSGKVNIDVPIYNITSGRISVPVKLVYNTQGIRVEDTPSVVGTGWELIAGGRITRKIMGGMMDLYKYDFGPTDTKIRGYQRKEHYTESSPGYSIDKAPDVFSCSVPGLSCQYFYSAEGIPYVLNDKNVKVKETVEKDMYFDNYTGYIIKKSNHDEYDSFTLINEIGINYTFDKFESGYSNTNILSGITDNVTSWMLTRIKDPLTGEEITIEYKDVGSISNNQRTDNSTAGISGCGCNYVDSKIISYSSTRWAKRISRITWSDGSVVLDYSADRQDQAQDIALKSVKVYNKDNVLIKDFEMVQSYFVSTGADSYNNKRLKLDKVLEYSVNRSDSKEYGFTYYPGTLPNRLSKEQDLWGYYNDNNASNLMPKLYFYPDMAPSFSSSLASNCFFPERLVNSNKKYYIINGADRSVNVNALKVGMLKDIHLPTGGKKTLGYEANQIKFGLDEIKGGGLRVSSEILDDGSNSYTKTYEYTSGTVLSLPQMAHMCNANSFFLCSDSDKSEFLNNNLRVYSYSFLSSFDMDPYGVLYNSVTEKQQGNGEIRNDYYSLAYDYSFVNWEIQKVPNDLCSFLVSSYSNKHFTLPLRTALSGKPHYIRYFEEGNLDMVKFKQYAYKQTKKVLMTESMRSKIGYMHTVSYVNNINYNYQKALKSEEIVEYYKRGGVNERTTYAYSESDLLIEVAKDMVNGQFDKIDLLYPSDLVGDQDQQGNNDENYLVYSEMVDKNINIPIFSQRYFEDTHNQTSALKGLSLNLYKNDGDNIRLFKSYRPSVNAKYPYNLQFDGQGKLNALSSNMFEEENEIKIYSNNKPSLIYNHQTGVSTVLEWDANDSSQPYLVAHTAENNDLYYESFEGKGSYNGVAYHGTLENSDASFGNNSWRPFFGQPCMGVLKDLDPNKEYWFQFWAKGNGRVSLDYLDNNGWSVSGNSWKPYTFKFKGLSIIYLVFEIEGLVDEIRIYPVGSEMLTRTQIPLVGVTSETDQNGISTYYEYDEFRRLKSIKEHDKNILTQYEYNYAKAETATSLSVSASSISFPSMGDLPRIIKVACDGAWTVSKPTWIKMDPISGNGNTTVEILALPNRLSGPRDGVIRFSIPGKSVSITVKQFGGDVLPMER